jgi:hypothetical protein
MLDVIKCMIVSALTTVELANFEEPAVIGVRKASHQLECDHKY